MYSGGSNGYSGGSGDGVLSNCDTKVYIGGNAHIGGSNLTPTSLYNADTGCVFGAGNGNSNYANTGAGRVDNTYVIINDEAVIGDSVYGGGNHGRVGNSGTGATSKIDILGGTISKNVYGGANSNGVYGSTTVNMKGGTVKGAIFGGSNTSGTISTTTSINITGGTLNGTNTGNTNTSGGVLYGGGFGSGTTVTQDTTINIKDTDANVVITGNCYGGSAQGTITRNTTVNIQDLPNNQNTNTISITGNVFAGGQGTSSQAATINGNSTLNVDGSNIQNASVFGGNDVNGVTNGNITVNIGGTYSSKVGRAYGGGNQDATGTEADTVKVNILSNADVGYAFNGGKAANFTTAGVSDTNRGIYLQGGHADNIFGGSDTSGDVNASHVYIISGTATNVYGGNNEGGTTTTSTVNVTGGTSTNVFGGGYQAATTTSNVNLTGGTVTNGFGGGNAANVTTSNIILNGANATATNIYGGSNSSGTVNTSNVTITSGTATNVYGGNNQGGNTVNTNVNINSGVTNVFGGGNQALTSGDTNLYLHNATVTGSAYGGGNGQTAVVGGNSTTKVDGTTVVNGDLFGGGNAAPNGNQSTNLSLVTTLIKGGWIKGDVYGGANTSVVYGNTVVKIGTSAVNDNSMTDGNIKIGDDTDIDQQTGLPTHGTVFGGGKSNTAGSANYDFTFESVTGDANIDINATGYDSGNGSHTFNIMRSVFGSGNAAKISGDGIVNIINYGTASNIKNNVSIQRASQVTLNNCHMYLAGTTDTTNEIATAVYTFNRIDDLILKNNTVLYLASGVNIVAKLQSLDSSGNKETVTVNSSGATPSVDNRIYLSQGRTIILKTEAGADGEVLGMAYVGMFKGTTNRQYGIYGDDYVQGSTVSQAVDELFTRNSYIQGKHYTSHNINLDGYYTKYNVDGKVEYQVINPTPDDATYYQWIMGKSSTDIYYEDIELIATKYATTATYVLNLAGLSYPNMIIDVKDIDCSDLSNSISLNDPDTIPNIATTGSDANTKFGLTMTAGNSGWQTRGTTYFLNNSTHHEEFDGKEQYLSDNSNTTPSFSLYLAHSKNITTTANLGTVKIHLEATYYEDIYAEPKIKNVYIILKLTTNDRMVGTDYYEGAITPGKQYNIFPTTTTTITQDSAFSAYYSLYVNNYSNGQFYQGFTGHYYHTVETSCVFPANTKITLIDKSASSPKYYYYIVSSADAQANKKIFRFTDFYAMDSEVEHYNADGSYYNSSTDTLYEEYIIHVDFEDTTLTNSLESKNIVVQLRDIYDTTGNTIRITVNNALYPMLFSVYNNIDATKELKLTTDKSVIYMGSELALNIETEYSFNKNSNSDIVYDTTHLEDQLGVRISISTGSDVLTASDLEGIYISYNGSNYFPRSDGSYRIKIADAVANVLANMTLHTENGNLETGTYTITAQSFGSIDGTYFSSAIASDSKNVQIVSTNYGFSVDLDDNSVLIDKATGKTKNNNNNLPFTIGYSGGFEHPKIVVSLYRRKYDQVCTYEYQLVNLRDYVTNTLTSTSIAYEYLVTDSLLATQNYTLTLKNKGLKTGTYKVVFTLYDGTNKICDMNKSIIIK